ncbi:secreted RxLR effector protein 161-like [Lucilia sericata]|uniref:secreted RxLR effector protein 161-like n=1 Tax=Lucilia sericata TaxID=13632 RepID=UPI0018A83549|nr:secreted RxLR effector protein 161-like [Lucilia sericata]
MYLTQCTRPDICHAVSYLSRLNNNPSQEHWNAVKRVFRYLKETKHSKLCYRQDGNNELIAYSDADWANDVDERKSITGYVVILQSGAISWSSKKQQRVALSSTEEEYMAMSAVTQEVVCLRELFYELVPDIPNKPTHILCDNRSAIALSSSNVYRARSKHIDVHHHFLREKKNAKQVEYFAIKTDEMIADSLTKATTAPKHNFCFQKLGLIIIK